jgi:hypothetical protein
MKSYFLQSSIVLIFQILLSIPLQAQSGWTQIASMQTYRAGASACVINDSIYVIGGITGDPFGTYWEVDVNEIFDPVNRSWLIKEAMPSARAFLYITSVDNTAIYALGGGYSVRCDTNEVYNILNNSWTAKKCLPFPWAGMAGAVVNGKIYLMGGNLTGRECYQYDPAEDSYTEKASLPADGCAGPFSVTVYNGLIYAFGGTDNYPDTALAAVCIYDPQTNVWTKAVNEMPTARYFLKTFLIEDKIYAIGGCNHSNSSLAAVEVYDPKTDMWDMLPDMPESNTKFCGVVYDNKIYTFGGTYDWAHGGDKVWVFDPQMVEVIQNSNVRKTYSLDQNFPNPFNPETKIRYTIPQPALVQIKLFDILGNEIETLVKEEKPAGTYEINWNAASAAVGLPSGVYFYQLKAGVYNAVKKMILLK